ncbi:MAG: hypothetical protein HY308_10870 [Gammaproteobacteria bacterium]|nr:hypothetical protein [Gammaproteobacteria bacterium]
MTFNKKHWIVVVLVVLGVSAAFNYQHIAVQLAPKKHAAATRSAAALAADELFWHALHNGEYQKISDVLTALTAAYLENPEDAVTAAHIGFLHTWTLAERPRLAQVPPTITDHVVLARKYFQEAVNLDPADARYLGFLASAMLAEGTVHHDQRLTRQGYFTMLDAVNAWPEFNLFTAGYVFSRQPADSPQFQKAIEWQWRAIDECVEEKVDRRNLDFSRYMKLYTATGNNRACWNSAIAPHNFEGFFLSMGDMLVKAGDWQTAQKIYANARFSPDYARWKFRPLLEERIRQAQVNVAVFRAPERKGEKPTVRMMVNSAYSCMACHQQQ